MEVYTQNKYILLCVNYTPNKLIFLKVYQKIGKNTYQ